MAKSNQNININTTVYNIINDCKKNIHFSKKFFKEFSNELNEELVSIIKDLNHKLYYEFRISIKIINISSEIHLLNNLASLIRLKKIQNRIILIQNDLNQVQQIFRHIIRHNAQLPINFLVQTLNEVSILLFSFQIFTENNMFAVFCFSLNYFLKTYYNQQLIHVHCQWKIYLNLIN